MFSSFFALRFAFGGSLCTGNKIHHRVSEEVLWPVFNVTKKSHIKFAQARPTFAGFAEVESDIRRSKAAFGDSTLQALKEMLRVTLDQELDPPFDTIFSGPNSIDEKIGKFGLCFGM